MFLGGILVNSEKDLLIGYKQFKRQFIEIPMTRRQKERISFEFKSTLLEYSYPHIKRKLLYKLNTFDCSIVYSSKDIKGKLMQQEKEYYYLECLNSIVNYINDDLTIITIDELGSTKFEMKIIGEISKNKNVIEIKTAKSFANKGLQFADNVVGVIRKHIENRDDNNFYEIIANKVKRSN